MTEVSVLFAAVAVSDIGAASAWYARLFGRPADIVVNENEEMWRFADPAWLYIVRDADGNVLAFIEVTNPEGS